MKKLAVSVSILCLAGAVLAQPEGLLKARAQGQLTACKSNEKNIATCLEMYASDYQGQYPKNLAALTNKNPKLGYLLAVPTCPAAGKDTYSATYKVKNAKRDKNGKFINPKDTDWFTFRCAGHNHKEADAPPNKPAYDSNSGLIER